MKFTKLSLIAAVAVSAITTSAMAEVELSANVAATNNYVWRGMTQTNNQAAVQGGLDIGADGFYLGTWLSNVDFSNGAGAGGTEVDFSAGHSGEISGIGYDVGYITYRYAGINGGDFDETYLGLSKDFGPVSAGITYSLGLNDAPDDIAVDLSFPLTQDYSFDLATGDYATYGKRYSVGVSKSFDKVDFSIAYSKFAADTATNNAADQSNVIVSAGTSF